MSTLNQDLTPALFTPNEIQHLRKVLKDVDSDHAPKYFESAVKRAAEMRAKKAGK